MNVYHKSSAKFFQGSIVCLNYSFDPFGAELALNQVEADLAFDQSPPIKKFLSNPTNLLNF